MKKYIAGLLTLAATQGAIAQNPNEVDFRLGNGLNITLNDKKHHFKIGGYIQTFGQYEEVKELDHEWRFDVRRAFLNFSGGINHDKFTFLLQVDFARNYPLLDAWVAYNPCRYLSISVGQKQSFSGTRGMMFDDMALALGNRTLVDRTFFDSGRELGIFVESRFPLGTTGIELGAAVTSGDGLNSFGGNATDFDLGGLKYSVRGSLFPLGFFSSGNDLTDTDFAREKSPKLQIGGAYSYNQGASNRIGEGHGNFELYNRYGKAAYPDYIKLSADLMLKYRGFTFLAQYVDAFARNLDGLHIAPSAGAFLQPKQIAEYLTLGSGVSVQAGYLFKKNWAIDARYSAILPEWKEKQQLIQTTNAVRAGVAKYFIDNRLKLQLATTYERYNDLAKNDRRFAMELNTHIVF